MNVAGPITAEEVYKSLQKRIDKAVKELEQGYKVQVLYLDRAGKPITVSEMGFSDPHNIVLRGVSMDGALTEIVVHMHSIELQIKTIKGKTKEKAPIGFLGGI